MKIIRILSRALILFALCQALGCGRPPLVEKAPNKVNNPNFSPGHKALIEQRKKQDGD
jgi:hypothetical protein